MIEESSNERVNLYEVVVTVLGQRLLTKWIGYGPDPSLWVLVNISSQIPDYLINSIPGEPFEPAINGEPSSSSEPPSE